MLGYLDIIRKPCPSQIVSFVKRFFGLKRRCPNFGEIVHEIFLPLSKLLPNTIYFVDGLDECEPEEVRKILKTFQEIVWQHGPKVFISGREALDVTNSIGDCIAIVISDEGNREDIRRFIEWRIEEKMRERQLTEDESVLQAIKRELTDKADRM